MNHPESGPGQPGENRSLDQADAAVAEQDTPEYKRLRGQVAGLMGGILSQHPDSHIGEVREIKKTELSGPRAATYDVDIQFDAKKHLPLYRTLYMRTDEFTCSLGLYEPEVNYPDDNSIEGGRDKLIGYVDFYALTSESHASEIFELYDPPVRDEYSGGAGVVDMTKNDLERLTEILHGLYAEIPRGPRLGQAKQAKDEGVQADSRGDSA